MSVRMVFLSIFSGPSNQYWKKNPFFTHTLTNVGLLLLKTAWSSLVKYGCEQFFFMEKGFRFMANRKMVFAFGFYRWLITFWNRHYDKAHGLWNYQHAMTMLVFILILFAILCAPDGYDNILALFLSSCVCVSFFFGFYFSFDIYTQHFSHSIIKYRWIVTQSNWMDFSSDVRFLSCIVISIVIFLSRWTFTMPFSCYNIHNPHTHMHTHRRTNKIHYVSA